YLKDISGPPINLPMVGEAMKKKAPDVVYQFRNPTTNRIDDKIMGLAYPGGLGQFAGLGWVVGAGADKSEVMAYLPTIRNNAIMGVGGVILIVIITTVVIAATISKPVIRMAQVMGQVGENLDLTLRSPVTTRDEIGRASETF